MKKTLLAASAVLAALPSVATAQKVQSGTKNGISYTATNRIIGQTSTATQAAGGSPIYLAPNKNGYSGTVGMLMTYSNGSAFVCSGSLLSDRRSILTAGHCVSDGGSKKAGGLVSTKIFFYDGSAGDDQYVYPVSGALQPGVSTIDVAEYRINKDYTGEVIDQNDIAVLYMADFAPSFAQGYEIYNGGDLTGDLFNVTGYGTRSLVGGAEGYTGAGAGAGVGRRRQGYNIYDYALGDSIFGGFFTDEDANGETFFGTADATYSYVSDFDNGTGQNDASCILATDFSAAGAKYCQRGIGPIEVGIAGGDSGGGAFINGQIASVNSYGLSFGPAYGDYKAGLNGSWGEFSGYVPTFIHADFIAGAMAAAVPEPSTWALMILGFGAVGGAMRRRQAKTSVRFA
jgi:hypothetical protein